MPQISHYDTTLGLLGRGALGLGIAAAVVTIVAYILALRQPESRKLRLFGRISYTVTALSVLSTFGILAWLVFHRQYQYQYVADYTSNTLAVSGPILPTWIRFAATWAGQEGSFLLWATWTAILGFLVFAKAGKYEARVMPFFVSVLGFLCAILSWQSPFKLLPVPSLADLAANPGWHFPPLDGQGLNPSLQNYWMTIHPPTIFFGFASLAVPYCYAIAALIWKDYRDWTSRVMPYCLLTCATLGLGLFMGGYWAYETQGWHGFWAWDPVENASFFPWLAITALVHGLVVQKSRGGMARTNTFLGILAFSLFMLGTLLTRSGALASKDASGQLISIHAFANIESSALVLVWTMSIVYFFGGLGLWLARFRSMPKRQTTGDTLVSRDFAFFLAVLLMIVACGLVAGLTTLPLVQSTFHLAPSAPKAKMYNRVMLPLALIAGLAMGCVPWLAWRKTNSETFLRKLLLPWFVMLGFGFFMLIWVQGAERNLQASQAALMTSILADTTPKDTMAAWISPSIQRMAVVALASIGLLAALSNAMLAYRVFRAKPLAAGGWLAHVGIGVLMIGIIVSNTYERTTRFVLVDGGAPKAAFGYQFAFTKMTGHPPDYRPLNPDYDTTNAVQLAVTPPGASGNTAPSQAGFLPEGPSGTFMVSPRWFVHNLNSVASEKDVEHMRWPAIQKYLGHDLYVGLAADPFIEFPSDDPTGAEQGITLRPKEKRVLGPYVLGYYDSFGEPGKVMGVHLVLRTPEGKIIEAFPELRVDEGMLAVNVPVSGIPNSAIYLDRLDPATKAATLRISLPGYDGRWVIPLEVTFKPWINLVWTGVLIAVAGVLLAMVHRTLEARKVSDAPGKESGEAVPIRQVWEMPTDGEPAVAVAGGAPAPSPSPPGTNGKSGNGNTSTGKSGNGKNGAAGRKGKSTTKPRVS